MTARPTWLFRVASRPEDGAGHVMRCLILARTMSDTFAPIFLLDAQGEQWRERLAAHDMAAALNDDLVDREAAGVMLDDYRLEPEDEARWRCRVGVTAAMDDFCRPHPSVDLVVNPAPGLDGNELAGTSALLGPRFALVDPQLTEMRARAPTELVGRVLVTMGAADGANASSLTLDALARLAESGFRPEIRVVLGADAPHLEEVRRRVGEFDGRLEIDVGLPNLAAAYSWADMAVGAGGVGMLERMAAGVPSIALITADNQRSAVEGAAHLGATMSVGTLAGLTANSLSTQIRSLADDRSGRATLAACGRTLVDGRGPERVAETLAMLVSNRQNGPAWHRA